MTSGFLFRFQNFRPRQYHFWNNVKVEHCRCLYSTAAATQAVPQFSRHCDKPTIEPVEGQVQGKIPSWLQGTLYRNGPGIMKVGNDHYRHIFDGLAVLHKYDINNGKATYMSRPLESESYKRNMKANRIVVSEFGTVAFPDPCKNIFQRLTSKFKLKGFDTTTDNCNVNVGFYGDQLYAMTETNFIRQIDPDNLKTIGSRTNLASFATIHHATAHPHVLEDGHILNMGSNFKSKGGGANYCVVKIPPKSKDDTTGFTGIKMVAEIPVSSPTFPSYYHSFGMTKDKIIFIETPLRLDLVKIVKAGLLGNKSFSECLTWCPDKKAKIHVVSLNTGNIYPIAYETEPFFTFHHINAYEEDGHIIVDVAGYDKGDVVPTWEDKSHKKESLQESNEDTSQIEQTKEGEATGRRFVLPLRVSSNAKPNDNVVTLKNTTATATTYLGTEPGRNFGKVTVNCVPQHLTKDWVELPRINYKYNGQKYNYFYAISSIKPPNHTSPEADSIVKVDVNQNQTIRWKDPEMIPSEPIFVSNPNPKSEDDGVVITALMHRNEEAATTLLVLNAKDLQELVRVRFNTAGTLTGTFHGLWSMEGETIHHY